VNMWSEWKSNHWVPHAVMMALLTGGRDKQWCKSSVKCWGW